MSGATIVDQTVTIALAPDYKLPPTASSATFTATDNQNAGGTPSVVKKAEEVVSGVLSTGFALGRDTLNKAKSFDEKHWLTSTAAAKIASLDQMIGLSEKLTIGAAMVNDILEEMDQKFHVFQKTKIALSVAEQTASSAGSAIMKNSYVLSGTSWVTGAFSRLTKAATGPNTKEKSAEEEGKKLAEDSLKVAPSEQPSKPTFTQGLIL